MVKVSEVNRSPQPSSQDIGKQDDDDDDDIQGVLEQDQKSNRSDRQFPKF